MKNKESIADELYNKLAKFSDLEMKDGEGNTTDEIDTAVIFQVNYGSNHDPKIITFNMFDPEVLEMLYSKQLTDEFDSEDREKWYAFVNEMRDFAMTRSMAWKVEDFTKARFDKNDFDFIRNNSNYSAKDATMESRMYGSKRSSYTEQANTRLIVRHNTAIEEEKHGARSRNIKAIFVENADGERFLVPRNHLPTARAMARHISNEGVINDDIAEAIIEMHDEMKSLRKFTRKARSTDRMMEGAEKVVEAAKMRYGKVKKTLESIQKQKGYAAFAETFERTPLEESDEDTFENLRNTLTTTVYNEEFDEALPYLTRALKEAEDDSEAAYKMRMQQADDEIKNRSQSVLELQSLPLLGSKENYKPTMEKITSMIEQLRASEFDDPRQKKEAVSRMKYALLAMFADEVLGNLNTKALDMGVLNAISSLDLMYKNDAHMYAPVVPPKEHVAMAMHLYLLWSQGKVEYAGVEEAIEEVDMFEAWADQVTEGSMHRELEDAVDVLYTYAQELGNTNPDYETVIDVADHLEDTDYEGAEDVVKSSDIGEQIVEILRDVGPTIGELVSKWKTSNNDSLAGADVMDDGDWEEAGDEDVSDTPDGFNDDGSYNTSDDEANEFDEYEDEEEKQTESDELGDIRTLAGMK